MAPDQVTPDRAAQAGIAARGPETWGVVGLVLAVIPLAAAWLPIWGTETVVSTSQEVSTRSTSLVSSEGWAVLAVLLVPVAVALVPVVLRSGPQAQRARVAAALLLGAGVLLGAASIGIAYLPAAVALIVAAVQGR